MRTIVTFIMSISLCVYMNAQELDWGDFENEVSWWKTWGGTTAVVNNPFKEVNTSNKVLKYIPDSLWRGISIYFENPPLNSSHLAISLYAYADTTTALQLGMPTNDPSDTFFVKRTLLGGGWRYIEFDLSSLKAYYYKYFIIQTVELTNYYFDNLSVKTVINTQVKKEEPASLSVFPNPAKEYIKISGISSVADLRILSLSGQVVLQKKISDNEYTSVKMLKKGFYTAEIAENGNVTIQKLIIN